MKVKVLKKFRDLKEAKLRVKDEEFEVNKDRFAELNGTRFGKLVEEVKDKKETKK